MNIRLLSIFIFVCLIVSCATPDELRQQTPLLNLKSNKPSKSVAICISDKWEGSLNFFSWHLIYV